MVITFRQPFDILAETAIAHAEKKAADDVADGFLQIWLGIPVENILGLSALESTWGEHRFAAQGNNYFGIHYPAPFATGYVLSAGGTRVAMFASYADSVRSFTAIFRVYHTGQARPQSVRDRVAEQRQVRDRYTDRSEASRLCR